MSFKLYKKEEIEALKEIVEMWVGEGFVAELSEEQQSIVDKLNGKANELSDDFYMNEGAVIFVKGKMITGIHPDNLENNFKALATGDMKIDWEQLLVDSNKNKEKV